MNTKVNPQWLTAGYGYLRAAMVESVEAIEHHGWKWWKAQQKDLPQLQMELVDIWHFALSASIIDYQGDVRATADALAAQLAQTSVQVQFDGTEYHPVQRSLLDNLELMAGQCPHLVAFSVATVSLNSPTAPYDGLSAVLMEGAKSMLRRASAKAQACCCWCCQVRVVEINPSLIPHRA